MNSDSDSDDDFSKNFLEKLLAQKEAKLEAAKVDSKKKSNQPERRSADGSMSYLEAARRGVAVNQPESTAAESGNTNGAKGVLKAADGKDTGNGAVRATNAAEGASTIGANRGTDDGIRAQPATTNLSSKKEVKTQRLNMIPDATDDDEEVVGESADQHPEKGWTTRALGSAHARTPAGVKAENDKFSRYEQDTSQRFIGEIEEGLVFMAKDGGVQIQIDPEFEWTSIFDADKITRILLRLCGASYDYGRLEGNARYKEKVRPAIDQDAKTVEEITQT